MRIPASVRQHGPALFTALSTSTFNRSLRGLAILRVLRFLGIRGSLPLFLLVLAAPRVKSMLMRAAQRR